MEELSGIIGKNIQNLRQSAGMKQSDLGELLNYSDKLISKWERGESAPNAFTLKQLSEIFGVTVDYLFTEHSGDTVVEYSARQTTDRKYSSRAIIAGISVCGIWMLSMLLYVVLWTTVGNFPSIFVYTLPAAVILVLILNSVWNHGRHNYIIIGLLLVSIVLTVYVALWKFNVWQIFLLLIPAELIVFLCALLTKKKETVHSPEGEKEKKETAE